MTMAPAELRTLIKRQAPDWFVSFVYWITARLKPSLAHRTPLVMCTVDFRDTEPPSAPAGYVLTRLPLSGSSSEWIDTLKAAGISVTQATWVRDFKGGQAFVAAVFRESEMAGTASLTRLGDPDRGVGLVTWVGVRPEHRGQGLGRVLIDACLHEARRSGLVAVVLLTDDHRLAAIKTYLDRGFRPCLHSWDWTHAPRWRSISTKLGVKLPSCAEESHASAIALIP